jgi:hypothetical protein
LNLLWWFLVEKRAGVLEPDLRVVEDALGVAYKEVASWHERTVELSEDALLRLIREVDDDIPASNQVEPLRVGVGEQVMPFKLQVAF